MYGALVLYLHERTAICKNPNKCYKPELFICLLDFIPVTYQIKLTPLTLHTIVYGYLFIF